jgi:hypothetical protein
VSQVLGLLGVNVLRSVSVFEHRELWARDSPCDVAMHDPHAWIISWEGHEEITASR